MIDEPAELAELGAVATADLAWPQPAMSSSAAQPAAAGISARRDG